MSRTSLTLKDILLVVLVIILVATITVFAYLSYQNSKCIANPLVYGARQIESAYRYEVFGNLQILAPPNSKAPILYFNSTRSWLE